jgi:OOP family OmpA-OmpF porin
MRISQKFSLYALALFCIPVAVSQAAIPEGYWVDGSGKVVQSATAGQCWHSGAWTPGLAKEPCDPEINKVALLLLPAAQAALAIAPVLAAPTTSLATVKTSATRLQISADALFGFDKHTLNQEGETLLDKLVLQIKSADAYQIELVGHTDRFGSMAYNQKLSERRAGSVRDYLMAQGIMASRMTASGKGESEPLTGVGDCRGKFSAKVVTCLQQDRRVDVEIQGTTRKP